MSARKKGSLPSNKANIVAQSNQPITNGGDIGFSKNSTPLADLVGGGTGGGTYSGTSYPADSLVMSFEIFIPLFLALAFWFVSIHLWEESARFQKWLIKDEKDAPDPQSGVGVTASWTIIIVLSTFLSWLQTRPSLHDNAPLPLDFLRSILLYPANYVTAVFMLGIVPAALAFCKFVLAIPLARTATNKVDGTSSIRHSPMTAIFGAIIGAINLAGSSITVWVWLKAGK